jgi:hypothetical protein
MTGHALAGVAVLALGCTGPARVVHPQPCPATPLESERISLELLIPHTDRLFIPPMPVPPTLHGRRMTVRVVVDTTGRVMRDSVMICGLQDPTYLQRVAEEVSAMRFRPGLIRAKHVVAPTLFTYDF